MELALLSLTDVRGMDAYQLGPNTRASSRSMASNLNQSRNDRAGNGGRATTAANAPTAGDPSYRPRLSGGHLGGLSVRLTVETHARG